MDLMRNNKEVEYKKRKYYSASPRRTAFDEEVILSKGIDAIFDEGK